MVIALDYGPDGVNGINALLRHWDANLELWGDRGHNNNCDFDLLLSNTGKKAFWLCMLVSWNLPFGPLKDCHENMHKLNETLDAIYSTRRPHNTPLFLARFDGIKRCYNRMGIMYDGDDSIENQLWRQLKKRVYRTNDGKRADFARLSVHD